MLLLNIFFFYGILYLLLRGEYMKKFFIVLFMGLFLCGCGKVEEKGVETLMKENEFIIVDVRTKEEFEELHVEDAINIPYDEINEDTELDKDKLIFVYCRSGNRSGKAYDTLESLGYEVYDLGGIDSIDLPKTK